MKKNYSFGIFAMATMLFTASCQEQEIVQQGLAGADATVSINVTTPELGVSTRAFGDGMTAQTLHYAVYNVKGEGENRTRTYLPELTVENHAFELSTQIDLQLVTGNTYDVIFWADTDGNAPYSIDWSNGTVSVDYSNVTSNNENYDAFFNWITIDVTGAKTESVKLYRPFGQLNIGTSDIEEARKAGFTIAQTSVTVPTYETLNLWTKEVADETTVTFGRADIPANETFPVANHKYLAMNYLLLPADKELVEVTFDFYSDANEAKNRVYSSVPVQRNWRTNIYGKLMTSEIDVNIEIAPLFKDQAVHPDSIYNIEVWDGVSVEEPNIVVDPVTDEPVAEVTNGAQLAYIAQMLNGGFASNAPATRAGESVDYANITITLGSNIDLGNEQWLPIGTSENPFTGTLDGNGYTITNLKIAVAEGKDSKAYVGFFGYAKDVTIKNVTFENVDLNIACLDIDHSQGHIGAVAGSLEGTSTIEDVTVMGDVKVYATQTANGASRVAVVAGGNTYGNVTMKNVNVEANEGSYLTANNNTGALAGQLQGKILFEDCSSNIDVTVNKFFAGGLIGIAPQDAKFVNCHTTGDVAVVAGREGRHNDEFRVGGIAGGWTDGKNNVCTLENCSYTGKVSGKNVDGSVAEPLDYDGYVGRGYTLTNCAGSKVIIDGTEFVQKYNDKYGIYTINGLNPVATADELVAALEANEGVYFLNDIKIEPASMSNAYGATGINVKNGQTIDGRGHTLNIKGAGGTWDSGINTTGGVIKNLTVTGSFRGIFINHTSSHSEKVVLENVTIGGNGTVYTLSCDQGLYQGIEATNCTFNGWTSFAKTAGEAKFVNCTFGEGSGYKYCRPYSNTEFVNCTFCPGYAVDETRATVTFTDCTWEE